MPDMRRCFVLFVAAILAYGAAFAWYLLDRFDLVDLVRDVNQNDAFHYFQIAYRMAGGEFSTFDGITRTNGYHPLWLFLITPFYWVFDKTEALFAIKAFEIMLVAGGVALVACAARVARLPWVLLFAAPPALYRIPALFAGTEAAAALFVLGLFLLAVCLFARDPAQWRWPLAAVAFALPWVRLEYVAVSLAATAALVLLEWSWRDGPLRGRVRSLLSVRAGVPFLAAGAGLLAYFTWNAVVFGGVLPVSGATRRWWAQNHWEQGDGYSLAKNIHAFLQTDVFDDELLIALEVCVCMGVVWWFSRRSRGRDDWLLLAFLAGVSGLAAGHLAMFAQSVLTAVPDFGLSERDFVPAYLLNTIVVPARCYVALWSVRRVLEPRLARRASSAGAARRASGVSGMAIVAVGAVFLLPAADAAAPFRSVGRHDLNGRDREVLPYMGTLAMNRVLPGEDSVVGSWASGVVAYFSRFPVMDLDGLVNSRDYLQAQKAGTEAAFLRRHGITHFADVRFLEPDGPGSALQDGTPAGLFESPWYVTWDFIRQFQLWPPEWRRTQWSEVDRAEWFWERMAPHLEHQPDGVGLLVDGRMAQAFSRDCAGGLAVWTWAGQEEPVRVPWTQTSTGFCASAVVLPHDALPPVRTATMTGDEYLSDRYGERRPAIGAGFDVRLVENRLVYAKESCGRDDVEARFFLHVDPVDPDDLPAPRRRRGFDNLDFNFATHGLLFKPCVAEVPLPDYGAAAVRTGQFERVEGGYHPLWEREIRVGPGGVALGEHLADRVEGRRAAIESDFDVHLVDGALVYVKEQCGPDDVDARFFVAVTPADPDDLPADRRPYGFDNLDFRFDGRGARFGGACLAEVPLPDYGVAEIRTGQFVAVGDGFHFFWEGEILVGPGGAALGEHLADRVAGRRAAIESGFDVHLIDGALVYVKEQCGPDDVDARFFVAVTPADPDDLPADRRPYGFDNLDFRFDGRGARFGGACLAEVPLPDYGVAEIRTGQFVAVGDDSHFFWEGEILVGPGGAALGEHLADRVEGRSAAIESDFDVHLVDGALVYVKEQCGPDDVDARFFLAVTPADPDDLSAPRRPHGFDNLDFRFDGRGVRFGGACLAEVPLPDYGVAEIRTGQYVAVGDGSHVLWEGEIRVGPDGVALAEHLARLVAGRRPAIASAFDVHLVDGALVYVKEQCGPGDVDAQFFLHVEAADPDDLPAPRGPHGFAALDFRFDERGARFGGACLAEVALPDYGVAAVRTGQYVAVGDGSHVLWEGEIRVGRD